MNRWAFLLFAALCVLPADAVAGGEKAIGDVKSLSGNWRSEGLRSPAQIHINEDGTYQGTASTGARTTGQITVTGGQATYQSSTSTGTVTLSEDGGTEVLTFLPSTGRTPQRLQRAP
jgi:hypothetical protein